MIVQILNAEPDGLARTCAGNRQRIDQQPQLMIQYVSGGDKFVHFLIRENDVPRLLCIRQASKSDFPGFSILEYACRDALPAPARHPNSGKVD